MDEGGFVNFNPDRGSGGKQLFFWRGVRFLGRIDGPALEGSLV